MPRHTTIVATLGPASRDPFVPETLISASVCRNFLHGNAQDHIAPAASLRDMAARVGRGMLADRQGPKTRIGEQTLPEKTACTDQKNSHDIPEKIFLRMNE